MKAKFLPLIMSVAVVLTIASCKSKEKAETTTVEKEQGFKEIVIPCQNEGKSDEEFYRADASATSATLQVSREKALLAAKQRLASLINAKIKSVTDRYVNETEVADRSNFEQKFENLTREVVNQNLVDVRVACEKAGTIDGGKYQTFIAVEASKSAIRDGISNNLSNKDKIQVDYDKKKFEEIYNEEMKKLEEE
ncbi:MAG: hypothetical protein JXR60_02235 [Bacteroidales bacterium]|nr:hypothetical protein [Bacteroidales bacterium]